MKRIFLLPLLLLCIVVGQANEIESDSSVVARKERRGGFLKTLAKPFKWIGRNWSAYDTAYCIPAKYDWVVQLQNTTSMEWLNLSTEEGMNIKMHSKMSNNVGPYLGYSFLMYGYTIDLNALHGTNRREEFTLSINSNLVNIDLIRRRTGGDFITSSMIGTLETPMETTLDVVDMTSAANEYGLGDLVDYDITGININYFLNHKRYSNPAAFTNGALQLRSAGSWILGLGYSHQKTSSNVSSAIVNYGFGMLNDCLSSSERATLLSEANRIESANYKSLDDYFSHLASLPAGSVEYKKNFTNLYNSSVFQPYIFGEKVYENGEFIGLKDYGLLSVLLNDMPSVSTIDDWNIHVGYAYNYVISPKWLLGVSLIAAPGIKRVRYDNSGTVSGLTADEMANAMNAYYGFTDMPEDLKFHGSDLRVDESYIHFGTDFYGRASLTYTNDRWRAGININANAYFLRSQDLDITNIYGSAVIYVGYCFGKPTKFYRKKLSN